jgi:uncharacterized FlgJ-related protein
MKYTNFLIMALLTLMSATLLSPAQVCAQVAEPTTTNDTKADNWTKITPEEYIYKWRDIAIDNMEVYGIPASITMGQAILESGYGNGYLARVANNHFCIKCKGDWTGRTITHNDDNPNDCFRAYDSAEDSFRDHAEFLNNGSRYDFLFGYDADDYKNWAKGLKKAGYATAPDYAERLIGVIERYNLHLLDKKNGIKQYDDYIAKRADIDLAKLKQTVETSNEEATHERESVAEGKQTVVSDIATAYADKGIDPNNFRVTMNSHKGYNVYLTNRAHYVVAKSGDSYESLAKLFAVSARSLRKFNDVAKDDTLAEGDIVYIEQKVEGWRGEGLLHEVQEGETLHMVSQLYGIRLKSLAKHNNVRPTSPLVEGQTIRLR